MHKFVMTLISATLVIGLAAAVSAEVPNLISYQGRLTESDGSPVSDGDYNLTFQIVEHDPVLLGEPVLWSSGVRPVAVADGLFVYYLGSSVPLPLSIFADDGLESYFVRVFIEGSMLASGGVQLATVPFAFEAINSDTAAYAHAGPGSGATGWVDDGSVVRLQNSNDNVGIGVSDPTEKLVVGDINLGMSFDDQYIVCGNGYHSGYSGFKLGYNTDNFARMKWYGTGEELTFDTRSHGVFYNNSLVLKQGKIGINNSSPSELLAIGSDLGAAYGDLVQIGNTVAGRYSGFMFGEDADNRGAMLWINNSNEFRLGYKTGGADYGAHLVLSDGELIVNSGPGNNSVQLPTDAISANEILDEPGIASVDRYTAFAIPSDWDHIVSRTCNFPAAGYAVVLATADLHYYKEEDENYTVEFAITDDALVGPHSYRWDFGDALSNNAEAFDDPVTIHEVFSVSAGITNFFFFTKVTSGSPAKTWDVRMTVMFFPAAYGAISLAAASPDDNEDFSTVAAQPRLYTSEVLPTAVVNQSVEERIQTEADALRAEFEQQLEAMREEFQQQLNALTDGRQ